MIDSLEFNNLKFSYTDHIELFSSLSFKFPLNKWVSINGEFGTGKSTLVKLLLGLETPSSGAILLNGNNIHDMGYDWFSTQLSMIGHLLEEDGLLSNQSLFDNLRLPMVYHKNSSQEDSERWINYLFEKFSLMGLRNDRPAFVTDEVRRITAIIRALVLKPEMVILYNPFKGLSSMSQRRAIALLEEFEKDHGLKHIIFVSEDNLNNNKNIVKFEIKQGSINEI